MADDFRKNDAIPQNEKDSWKNFFPRSFLEKESLDFSFSGLKSAVKRYIDANPPMSDLDFSKISFAFEEAVFEVLLKKILYAAESRSVQSIILAGGVSANTELKNRLQAACDLHEYYFLAPKKIVYSQDNAAMIGIRGYYQILRYQL